MNQVVLNLFFVLLIASLGGFLAKVLKLPLLLGYILGGFIGGIFYPQTSLTVVEDLAQIGIIFLLFSVGLELSLKNLIRVGNIAILGSIIQILATILLSFILISILGISPAPAFVLAAGFSLSSTAIVIKILKDKGEADTIHGQIAIAWLLVQDLAVIPMIVLLPALSPNRAGEPLAAAGKSLAFAVILLAFIIFVGRKVAPFIIHKVAGANTRELLNLSAVVLALGTASFVSIFGISPALGAFLAGVVLSETQENHAVFAETRPLRDLFVILFFATLGFLVAPATIISHLGIIVLLSIFVILSKAIIIFLISYAFGYTGKTAVALSLDLSQIGEFSFLLFLAGKGMGILSDELTSVGMATALITLLATPFLIKSTIPLWRKLKNLGLLKASANAGRPQADFKNHIIICGFGRMGKWVGRALTSAKISFVVIDYNQKIVHQAKKESLPVIFGDPAEPQVLEAAGVGEAKAIVIALPDRITQEEIISYCETKNPHVKIIARAHLDEDVRLLTHLKVKKIIQPEFEGAIAAIRDIFTTLGRPKEEIAARTKALRLSHSSYAQ